MSEAAESYELEAEHRAIRDYLKREMRKRGVMEVDTIKPKRKKSEEKLSRWSSSNSTIKTDRTGRDVLLSSDEEDSRSPQCGRAVSGRNKPSEAESNNPFQSFVVDTSLGSSSGTSSNRLLHSRLPAEHTGINNSSSSNKSRHVKGFFNPVGQVEMPALIPEHSEADKNERECPVVDNWLVDDVGQLHSKRKAKDPFATTSLLSDRDTEMTNKGKRPRLGAVKRKEKMGGRGRNVPEDDSLGTRTKCIDDTTILVSDSDNEAEECSSYNVQHTTVPTFSHHTSLQPPPYPLPTSSLSTTAPSTTAVPMLRIRVKIENRSYLIPCHSHSSIGWLGEQAAERCYTQQGVRPKLMLTTPDGAHLSAEDLVSQVLQSGEEVVGVVEHWHHPPLLERYQTACRNARLGETV